MIVFLLNIFTAAVGSKANEENKHDSVWLSHASTCYLTQNSLNVLSRFSTSIINVYLICFMRNALDTTLLVILTKSKEFYLLDLDLNKHSVSFKFC